MNKELKVPRCPEIRGNHAGQSRQRIRQLEYAKAGICGICCKCPVTGRRERCESCTLRYRLSRPRKNRFPAIWKENKPKLIEDLRLLDWSLPPGVNAEKMSLTVDELKRYRIRYLGFRGKAGRPRK